MCIVISSQLIHYDFLKKLVKEACLAPLFFTSACVFLLVALTGDGRFSFTESSVICISSSLASVESLSQTFSVTEKQQFPINALLEYDQSSYDCFNQQEGAGKKTLRSPAT